jgi:carbon storage regulator
VKCGDSWSDLLAAAHQYAHFNAISGTTAIGPENAHAWGHFSTCSLSQGGAVVLVLTRKIGEVVVIGGGIRVTVTAIKGNKVCLGIDAPPNVRVDREEIHHRLREFSRPERSLVPV